MLPGPGEASRQLGPEDQILAVAQGDQDFEASLICSFATSCAKSKAKKARPCACRFARRCRRSSVRKIVNIVRDEVKLTANLATAKLIEVSSEDGSASPWV